MIKVNKKTGRKIRLIDLGIWAIFSVVVIYDGIITGVITKPTWLFIIFLLLASLVLKIIAVKEKGKKKPGKITIQKLLKWFDLGILFAVIYFYIFFVRQYPMEGMLLIETCILPFVIVAKLTSILSKEK
jgi:membrane protease YdiL (CAAX protease family)